MDAEIEPRRLNELNQLFHAVESVAENGFIFVCDVRNDYSRWSSSAVRRFGLPGEFMHNAGAVWGEHVHPDDKEVYRGRLDAVFNGLTPSYDMQYRALDASGTYVVCTGRGTALCDEHGRPDFFMGIIRDNGSVDSADKLTGFLNQYGLFEQVEELFAARRSACLLLVAVSRFSAINDMWGYGFGNVVIHKLVQTLRREFKDEGMLFRIDGVRFVLLTQSIPFGELAERYERLRKRVAYELEVDGYRPMLTLYGSALDLADFTEAPGTVLPCLEHCASCSKTQRGGELMLFSNGMNEDNVSMLAILNSVRLSIEQGCRGFMLHYQPIVGAADGTLRGAEALLRWESPDYGLVPPGRFIPLIENDPLFVRLGEWILGRAMQDMLHLALNNPAFTLSVNLSYRQMQQPDFVEMVVRLLKQTGYPARSLCLEITERCRLIDKARLALILSQLRGVGVRFAIDDFGTGYSSLEILNSLSFDVVKVDKSFVDNMVGDLKTTQFVTTMNSLAEACGASTCAEGVETAQQRDAVRACGIDCIQGYFFSRPLSLTSFEEAYA
ncbi:MAG: EAL domain-containing protein [Coriobacteriales bacterium]